MEEDDEVRGGWKTTTVPSPLDIGNHFQVTRDGETRSYEILDVLGKEEEGYPVTLITVRRIDSGS